MLARAGFVRVGRRENVTSGGLHESRISAPNLLERITGHLAERVGSPDKWTVRKVEIYDDARGCMVDWTEMDDGPWAHDYLGEDSKYVK